MASDERFGPQLDALLAAAVALNAALRPGPRWGGDRRAAQHFLRLLGELSDEALVGLDRRVRSWSEWSGWGGGQHIGRGMASDDELIAHASAAACCFVNNGYLREAAARELQRDDRRSLRLLTIRATDWVPEVARAALDGVRLSDAPSFVDHLALLESLTGARSRAGELQNLIAEKLSDSAATERIAALTTAPDAKSRRAAWKWLAKLRPEAVSARLLEAARDTDAWIRAWAYRQVDDATEETKQGVVAVMLEDPIGAHRARGLRTAVAMGSVDEGRLQDALSDRSSGVRAVAQEALMQRDIDPRDSYLRSLAGDPPVGDIYGLGEVGARADAELIRPLLQHPLPTRRRALTACARLGAEDIIALAMRALDDTNGRVARDAARLLSSKSLLSHHLDEIEERAFGGSPARRRHAITVLRSSRWRWLLGIVSAYASDDPQLADFARNELADWLRSSASATFRPPPGYAERIEEWVPSLPAEAQRHIKFILQTATST